MSLPCRPRSPMTRRRVSPSPSSRGRPGGPPSPRRCSGTRSSSSNPDVATALTRAADVDVRALQADLRAAVEGEVRFDPGTRAIYSTDASSYRQPPIGVVIPKGVEDVVAAVAVCRDHGAPVLARGGATSLAGQCCNTAVIIDFSKYLNRILYIDREAKLARVEPGTILDD